jgi:hypothetical protein
MVTNRREDSDKTPVNQGLEGIGSELNKIGASAPYDFEARSLTACGGLLPVATMLEKLEFHSLRKSRKYSKEARRGVNKNA